MLQKLQLRAQHLIKIIGKLHATPQVVLPVPVHQNRKPQSQKEQQMHINCVKLVESSVILPEQLSKNICMIAALEK